MAADAAAGWSGRGGWSRRRLVTTIVAATITAVLAGEAAALEPGVYRLPFGRNAPGLSVGSGSALGTTPVALLFGKSLELRLTVVEPTDGGLRGNGDLFFGSGGVAYDFVSGPLTIRPLVSFDTAESGGLSTVAGIAVGLGF
jgi:hypothetical protein